MVGAEMRIKRAGLGLPVTKWKMEMITLFHSAPHYCGLIYMSHGSTISEV